VGVASGGKATGLARTGFGGSCMEKSLVMVLGFFNLVEIR
jgi:hypothetical protein